MKNISRRKSISFLALGSFLLLEKQNRNHTFRNDTPTFKIDVGDIVFVEGVRFISTIIKNYQTDFRYTHVGIVININGACVIIDSDFDDNTKYDGVNTKPFHIFIEKSKSFLVMRNKKISYTVKKYISSNAIGYIGKSFDFEFSWNNDDTYCTELVYNIINNSMEFGSDIDFKDILTPQIFHRHISRAGWLPVFTSGT